LNVAIEKKGSIALVRVEDAQIGADTAEEFKSGILDAIEPRGARLAIDLSRVEFIDSSGLGALVSLLKAVRPDGDLVLFGMKSGVREILRLTHLDAVFRCQEDETGALAALPQA
jgi:anti-sigma B factor antagonist